MVRRYIGSEGFGPDEIRILSDALAEAWRRIVAAGAKFNGQEERARETLAKIIIDLAKDGRMDRQGLIDGALIRFKP